MSFHPEAVSGVPSMSILPELSFDFVDTISPDRDASGSIHEFSPQQRYAKGNASLLHTYGAGTFCRFRIAAPQTVRGVPGVYALVVGGSVRYIGECMDLYKRFNVGYGNISPRNCYVGGQMTNCKINQCVLNESKFGRRVDLYFHATSQRSAIEKYLITLCAPPWNGQSRRHDPTLSQCCIVQITPDGDFSTADHVLTASRRIR